MDLSRIPAVARVSSPASYEIEQGDGKRTGESSPARSEMNQGDTDERGWEDACRWATNGDVKYSVSRKRLRSAFPAKS
jgi:hypothetical protein